MYLSHCNTILIKLTIRMPTKELDISRKLKLISYQQYNSYGYLYLVFHQYVSTIKKQNNFLYYLLFNFLS